MITNRIEKMKTSIHQVQRISLAVVMTITFLFVVPVVAQSQNEILSNKDYALINHVFKGHNKRIYLYKRTYAEKDWTLYFMDSTMRVIKDQIELGTTLSNNQLDALINDEIRKKIIREISVLVPISFQKNQLLSNIKLVDAFDTKSARLKNTFRVSKPVLINNLGIIKVVSPLQNIVEIYMEEDNTWKLIYRFGSTIIQD